MCLGSILGSILGGQWSDRIQAQQKAANSGVGYPEVGQEYSFVAVSLAVLRIL